MPLLQLTAVTKSFGAVRALRGVSFDLQAGEVHALLGENGAGKSTLIKLITGAHAPDAGQIEVDGRRVTRLTPASAHRLGIACIYQQPALFPDLTVAENIGLRLEVIRPLARVRWADRRRRATELLQRLGAQLSPDAEIRSLSMPEQQLVEIACALGTGARIVIMDEPTASLTQPEVERLFGVVRSLRRSGAGVIYISHRLEEILALADRVTVLRDGQTVGTRRVRSPAPRESSGTPLEPPGALASPAPAEVSPAGLDESELIALMVGRDVERMPPPAAPAAGSPIVLALKDVGCSFSGVRGVTLEIRAGEILGLAGLVGAGRTELARVLFGITPADAGEIRLRGQPIAITSPQVAVAHGIAYVPEDRRRHGIILEMPVASNVTLASHRRLFPTGWLRLGPERSLTQEFIRQLDVRAFSPDSPGSTLSGGNQQKVSLARWLATQPQVLILDEPTQGVDIGAKAEIHGLIRKLAKDGLAVLLISSDLPEVLGLSHRVGVMRGGALVATFDGRREAPELMAAALGQAIPSTRAQDLVP